jgi:hypothetical protein
MKKLTGISGLYLLNDGHLILVEWGEIINPKKDSELSAFILFDENVKYKWVKKATVDFILRDSEYLGEV